MVASAFIFLTFIASAFVLSHNQKADWVGSKLRRMFGSIFDFYIPKESVKEQAMHWYLPYKISGILVVPLIVLLFGGSYLGHFCSTS